MDRFAKRSREPPRDDDRVPRLPDRFSDSRPRGLQLLYPCECDGVLLGLRRGPGAQPPKRTPAERRTDMRRLTALFCCLLPLLNAGQNIGVLTASGDILLRGVNVPAAGTK